MAAGSGARCGGARTSPDVDPRYAPRGMPSPSATRTVGAMVEVAWARRTALVDSLLAAVFTLSCLGITKGLDEGPSGRPFDAGTVAIIVLAGLALVVRRRWPIPVLVVVTALADVYLALDYAG